MKKQKLTQDEIIYLANFLMVEAVPSFVPPRDLPERRKRVARDGLVRKHILQPTAKGLPWVAGSDSLTEEGADVALAALVATIDELDDR
jgi:hypothetical protein